MSAFRFAAVVALGLGVAGCAEATGPGTTGDGVAFTFDGGDYRAAGAPTFIGQDVGASTFAIAFADSVGGLVVAGFQLKDGTRGDLFILQLTRDETGPVTCGTGHDCHGRLLQGIDAANLQDVQAAWEIESGSVTVETRAEAHISGRFDDLVLRSGDAGTSRTVDSGTFALPLLAHAEGVAILRCFLARATGGGCG